MTKRFCDQCGTEIGLDDLYYLEQIRAINFIYRADPERRQQSEFILKKRDLCSKCSPATIPESEIAARG